MRQTVRVNLPGLPSRSNGTYNVVLCNLAAKVVVCGYQISNRQHEIVRQRIAAISVVLRRQRILLGQRVGKWHRRVSDDAGIAVILLDQNENVGHDRKFVRRIGSATSASELKASEKNSR